MSSDETQVWLTDELEAGIAVLNCTSIQSDRPRR